MNNESIELAVYVNNEKISNIPLKEDGYIFDKQNSSCTNNAVISWDNDTWSPVIFNINNYPTRCNFYFGDKSFCEINPDTTACTLLAQGATDELSFDDTKDNNLRYNNELANNYIDIGEEYLSDYEVLYINIDTSFIKNADVDACAKFYFDQNIVEGADLEDYGMICEQILSNSLLEDIVSQIDYVNSGVNGFDYEFLYEFLSSYIDQIYITALNLIQYKKVDKPLWKIVGVMNNVDDGTGKLETRLKVTRVQSIGKYSWDTSNSTINNGDGINEWSQADLMKLLNPGYESESVGGSLWWNNQSGNCYNGSNNTYIACDFSNSSLEKAKDYISDAVWHIGTVSLEKYANADSYSIYNFERDHTIGKSCGSSLSTCNDDVERTATWIGKVGLVYPSDYMYLSHLFEVSAIPTITPIYRDYSSTSVILEATASDISGFDDFVILPYAASLDFNIFPTVYLDADVKFLSGNGTIEDPYQIGF